MKTALIIRHVPVEGVAGFREPIEAAGYEVDRIDVDDPAFGSVDLREPDLLIMMGGPMGVYEQDVHPWISCQLRRLAQRAVGGVLVNLNGVEADFLRRAGKHPGAERAGHHLRAEAHAQRRTVRLQSHSKAA